LYNVNQLSLNRGKHMKKIVLSLAGVLAATAFAPEASALPAFARQTGMACNACHAQHFPILNGFGRAFKAAGYTMMGAQGKVEGDHLSIPDTLNAALLAKVRYQKQNIPGTPGAGKTAATGTGDGQWQFGDEFSLFFGGRVAENIGFLFEGNTANVGGSLLAGFKLPVVFDVGSAKLEVIPFTTDALGAQYGFELSSGGVMRANRWAESRRETSAIQYNADKGADAGAATGIALVAQNDFGFINVTKFSPSFAPGGNGGAIASTNFKNTYVRIAATPTVADWAMVVGAGSMSGSSFANLAAVEIATKQTFFDFQAHGDVAGKELGVYAQYANAPATLDSTGLVNNNSYNAGAFARKATTIGAEYNVIPHALSLGLAYRNAKNGAGAGVDGDNAWTVTAAYELTQNVALHADYSKYSGSAHNGVNALTSNYLLMLEAAW
jgi:hypothetical protein